MPEKTCPACGAPLDENAGGSVGILHADHDWEAETTYYRCTGPIQHMIFVADAEGIDAAYEDELFELVYADTGELWIPNFPEEETECPDCGAPLDARGFCTGCGTIDNDLLDDGQVLDSDPYDVDSQEF